MKRVDDNEPNPWYAEFEKSVAQREQETEMQKYSWNEPAKPAVPPSESEIAHAHVTRIANEYLRLRGKLNTGFGKMDKEDLIQKCGAVAEEIIELKAEALRKREPHLTKEMAFSKVYCAPETCTSARAEREAHGFVRYTDTEKSYSPVADPVAKQAAALDELRKLASDYRWANLRMTQEMAIAKIYIDPSNRDLAMAERAASRAMIGI